MGGRHVRQYGVLESSGAQHAQTTCPCAEAMFGTSIAVNVFAGDSCGSCPGRGASGGIADPKQDWRRLDCGRAFQTLNTGQSPGHERGLMPLTSPFYDTLLGLAPVRYRREGMLSMFQWQSAFVTKGSGPTQIMEACMWVVEVTVARCHGRRFSGSQHSLRKAVVPRKAWKHACGWLRLPWRSHLHGALICMARCWLRQDEHIRHDRPKTLPMICSGSNPV